MYINALVTYHRLRQAVAGLDKTRYTSVNTFYICRYILHIDTGSSRAQKTADDCSTRGQRGLGNC